jgi:hypothetical protein
MGFLDSISDFFKDDVYGGFLKPVGEGAWNSVIKPIYSGVVKPIASDSYQGIVKPLINTTGGLINTGGRFVDKSADNFLNLQSMISSPLFLIGVGIVAIIVLPKVVEKL